MALASLIVAVLAAIVAAFAAAQARRSSRAATDSAASARRQLELAEAGRHHDLTPRLTGLIRRGKFGDNELVITNAGPLNLTSLALNVRRPRTGELEVIHHLAEVPGGEAVMTVHTGPLRIEEQLTYPVTVMALDDDTATTAIDAVAGVDDETWTVTIRVALPPPPPHVY